MTYRKVEQGKQSNKFGTSVFLSGGKIEKVVIKQGKKQRQMRQERICGGGAHTAVLTTLPDNPE